MKAALLTGPETLQIVERETPSVGPGEARVEVLAMGLCGSDRRIFRGEYTHIAFPIVMGHEFAGRVEAVGPDVTSVRVGDTVVVNPPIYCRQCEPCRSNRENYCERVQSYGVAQPGGLSQQVVVRAENLYPAHGVPPDILSMAEPLACSLRGLDRASLRAGERVAVLGAGPIGLFATQLALLRGAAAVLVVDRNPGKLAVAESFGALSAILRPSVSLASLLPDGWRGGADVVVEATGAADLVAAGFDLCRMGGRLLLLGVYDRDAVAGLSPYWIYRREVSVIGSFAQRYEIADAVALMQSGRLGLDRLVTHRFPLDRAAEAFDVWDRPGEKIKIVIHPNEISG